VHEDHTGPPVGTLGISLPDSQAHRKCATMVSHLLPTRLRARGRAGNMSSPDTVPIPFNQHGYLEQGWYLTNAS